jgi:IS30 family transposase
MLTMYEQITIKTLCNQGVKVAQIARQLGCHRNTVRNVLSRNNPVDKQTRVKISLLDPHKDKIKELRDKKVTNFRIYEIITEEYKLHVSYVNVCKYIQKHFPKPVEAFGIQQSAPGEEAELDFGYLGRGKLCCLPRCGI